MQECSALTGVGLREGLAWLTTAVAAKLEADEKAEQERDKLKLRLR